MREMGLSLDEKMDFHLWYALFTHVCSNLLKSKSQLWQRFTHGAKPVNAVFAAVGKHSDNMLIFKESAGLQICDQT